MLALRLTVLLLILILQSVTQSQRLESIFQNPFKIKTNFLRDFMKRRDELFPFSFKTSIFDSPNPRLEGKNSNRRQMNGIRSPLPSNMVVKRRIPKPILENQRVQNFLREKIQANRTPAPKKHSPSDPYANRTFYAQNVQSSRLTIPLNLTKDARNPQNSTENTLTTSQALSQLKLLNINNSYWKNITSPQDPGNSTSVEGVTKTSFLGYVINTLTQLPVIGNVLRASVDPLYRPLINQLQTDNETIMRGENDMKNWCFGALGCIEPTYDFFHPIYRPVNLPPYPREKIKTIFTVHTRFDRRGYSVPAMEIEELDYSTFSTTRPTKMIIHGYLNDREETWVWEMVRGLLNHGDYNVITVDWGGGSYALYSQATANVRVVALEISRLLEWAVENLKLDVSTVHIIGHSLGAHTAGYVGERIRGLGRITGLDPAEPYFQYMPTTVRLDPSDAKFVDVIHTDIDSFFAITGPRGFGLQQAVGHVDFYPNGGKEQPGCNQLLARVPMTLMMEGEDIIEGINAAQTELMNCDHVRSAKLFTDSLTSRCPYLGFSCSSYEKFKEGKCFSCGEFGGSCSFMGINADMWEPGNNTNVKMFLQTHYAPNFCKFHYILTINFNDQEKPKGNLRGRLKISLIGEDGKVQKFDLTSLKPLKFPRKGSKTFLLEHYRDLSNSKDALIQWTYESDLLDPLTFCVLFCKADLSVSSLRLVSIDTPRAASKVLKMRSGEIKARDGEMLYGGETFMCHEKDSIVKVPSESTVKISASPECRESSTSSTNRESSTTKVERVSLGYYNG